MHSGQHGVGSRGRGLLFGGFKFFSLDNLFPFWEYAKMEKRIVKVERANGLFRVNVPRALIAKKRWFDVAYVLIEDDGDGKITIRRLVDGEALSGKNA